MTPDFILGIAFGVFVALAVSAVVIGTYSAWVLRRMGPR